MPVTEKELQEQFNHLEALLKATDKQLEHFLKVHEQYMRENACLDEVEQWADVDFRIDEMISYLLGKVR